MEFLDVEHQLDPHSPGGFYTRDFTKPMAVDRTFLHGKSHHPPTVYKSVVFGEAVRLRRLMNVTTFTETVSKNFGKVCPFVLQS